MFPVPESVQPLFDVLPLDRAMPTLVGEDPANPHVGLVKQITLDNPALAAGLWLYVDQLDASHAISQQIDDSTGSFWHGIMHRREGDFSNSHYWFRKAGHHPAMAQIQDYDPHAFVDAVEAAHTRGQTPADLLDMQRREWLSLFQWCAGHSD